MQVDATCVQLRPRPMFEAADLGVRLVQVSARSLLRTALPVYAVCAALCWSLLPLAPWAPSLALWLAKPWLDRTLLFVLSRSLFGQQTTAADLWAAARSVWWQGLLVSLSTRRLSPWRAFTQPARQLEGLKGNPLRKRVAQLKRGHQGAGLGATYGFWHLESALALGLPALALWLVPGGLSLTPLQWLGGDANLTGTVIFTLAYTVAVGVVEPFYVGAGFAMYINRRVELEAWDVEQALRHAFATR